MATKRLKELLEARKSSARENSGLLSFFYTMLNLLTSMTNLSLKMERRNDFFHI